MITPKIAVASAAAQQGSNIAEQRLRPGMGTLCAVQAFGTPDATRNGIAAAFAAIAHIEQCMHPTRPTSDVARLNDSLATRVAIDSATWEVLAMAQRIHDLSDGIFDPCLPGFPGGIRDLELLPDATAICHSPLAIDLGGIAKGYAVDQAIDALQFAGCSGGLVNAGGDLRIFGDPQQVLIRINDQETANITVHNTALAVSDVGAPDRPAEHQGYYRRNSTQAPAHKRVAVLAEQAMIADALTKCVMFCTDKTLDEIFSSLNARRMLIQGTCITTP